MLTSFAKEIVFSCDTVLDSSYASLFSVQIPVKFLYLLSLWSSTRGVWKDSVFHRCRCQLYSSNLPGCLWCCCCTNLSGIVPRRCSLHLYFPIVAFCLKILSEGKDWCRLSTNLGSSLSWGSGTPETLFSCLIKTLTHLIKGFLENGLSGFVSHGN